MNLHQNKPPTWLVHILRHPLVLGQATGTLDHKTHHGPDSGEATTFPHIVYSAMLRRTYIEVALFPGTPKLESRNPTKCPGSELPGLWEVIAPRPNLGSRRGLNRSCSPRRDLSNDVSYSRIGHRELVDSWLLVVGSQIVSLTPGPSFAHNLGDKCPNGQCEAIFDIYDSRPFQWHQEHPNARCFGSCCRALNIRESRRTPTLHFFQVLGFTPTLGQSRVATVWIFSKIWFSQHFVPTRFPMVPNDASNMFPLVPMCSLKHHTLSNIFYPNFNPLKMCSHTKEKAP